MGSDPPSMVGRERWEAVAAQGADFEVAGRQRRPQPAVSSVVWIPLDGLTMDEWILQGRRLGSIGRGVAWWIGDWVNYGNCKFGEKYSRAARITGYDSQSLMNMAYVALRFDASRRREALSWSHHAELAGLDTDQQEAWLDHAEAKGLSVRGLREELRTWRARIRRAHEAETAELAGGALPAADADSAHAVDAPTVCPQCGYCLTAETEAKPDESGVM